ncbi:conserved exported hypothetical protein [Candidatus Sulfopaludibacter sp. SbA3]|nr:conserved exported hypothetical protein [Candidatus Sulfopaludibacter sp. SbA3]
MKRILIAATWVLFGASVLPSQTGAKPTPKAVGLGKTEAVSNEEMNIRAYIELLRTDVKTSKSRIMGEVMRLDTGQATKFWPIYKEFETEYATLGDRIVAVVRDYTDHYGSMTDAVADQLGNQVLNIEQQRNVLKKKYYDRVKNELGAITATRFLQVENQLERIVDLQIASQLPVISEM